MVTKKFDKVILLPYAASDVHSDTPGGEAAFLYSEFFKDGEAIQICGDKLGGRLYIKDGLALYIISEGKTNAAMNTVLLLSRTDFDFSDTTFVLFGCCGSSVGHGVVGDFYIICGTADYDLGYVADHRDLESQNNPTWYPNVSLTNQAHFNLNKSLYEKAFNLLKDEQIDIPESANKLMMQSFANADWAKRYAKVMKGISMTSDTYWKGKYMHDRAQLINSYYDFDYPYVAAQMEDVAVARVFQNFNLLDKLLIFRYSVNMDEFMSEQTPENLWGDNNFGFDEKSFDELDNLFMPITKSATNLLMKLIFSKL